MWQLSVESPHQTEEHVVAHRIMCPLPCWAAESCWHEVEDIRLLRNIFDMEGCECMSISGEFRVTRASLLWEPLSSMFARHLP